MLDGFFYANFTLRRDYLLEALKIYTLFIAVA